jgi:hypothetical protein
MLAVPHPVELERVLREQLDVSAPALRCGVRRHRRFGAVIHRAQKFGLLAPARAV